MDIKWRSARHSAAMNQLELSEIEKTLRFVITCSTVFEPWNLNYIKFLGKCLGDSFEVTGNNYRTFFINFSTDQFCFRAAIKVSEKVTKQSMTKLNGADDDEKTIQELVILYLIYTL